MTLEVGVKALIKNNEGKFLFLLRSHPYEGEEECKWDVPGGRIVPGETLRDALAREIMEETGMTLLGEPAVIAAQDILRVAGKHTVRITFVAEASGDVTVDPKEHKEFCWATKEEMLELYHDRYLTPVLLRL